MDLQFYNTLSRKKEVFKPIHDGRVGLYTCGPTVYWFAHIGNFRTYIFADVLRRVLEFQGYGVEQIMNITDVGHLTDDADEGEDKMILAMKREGKTGQEIANFYADIFKKESDSLNILPASKYPKATDHIAEQISFIQKIQAEGFTYQTNDGVYFDTSKLSDYGKLSGQKLSDKLAGARVVVGHKKNPTDFALWKFSPTNSRREMEWPSPWGLGFPGWHIECSAMSKKYLGVPFDIHTGGIDHIPVHHENEIAQTWAAESKLAANYWLHGEFLTVDGQKMGKSLQNLYTIPDLIERGFGPLDFRFFVLSAHYRTLLNFTWEALAGANNAFRKLRLLARALNVGEVGALKYEQSFFEALADDLNTAEALAVMWGMLKDETIADGTKGASLLKFDAVLGLGLSEIIDQIEEIPVEVKSLMAARDQARQAKDWPAADDLRQQIYELGWEIDDTVTGVRAQRIK
jgi:cysteinyl-tRNA synthetase